MAIKAVLAVVSYRFKNVVLNTPPLTGCANKTILRRNRVAIVHLRGLDGDAARGGIIGSCHFIGKSVDRSNVACA